MEVGSRRAFVRADFIVGFRWPAWRGALPDDREGAFFAGRFFPVNFDPFDLRLARTTVAPTDEFLNGWSTSFKDSLHATIAQIADPSLDLRLARAIAGIGAEAYALHAARDEDMRSNQIHTPPTHIQ